MLALHTYSDTTGRPAPAPYPSTDQPDAPAVQLLPPGCFGPGTVPSERLSWMVALLPYLEQEPLYKQFNLEMGYAGNLPAAQTRIKTFLCPASEEATGGNGGGYERRLRRRNDVTHYVAMAGIGRDAAKQPADSAGNGFMGYDRRTSFAMIKDGTSNTIALMETNSEVGPWARGGSSNLRGIGLEDPLSGDREIFGSHPNGINVAMADGSVRYISYPIEPKKLADAITIAGGEPFDLD